ncbi:DinB family protein [Phycicoccus flavus]|uniref:DinB family protein n=1 Tax=Phycicoccus flavus TaxID=2502783 RepID=UPI000FEBB9F3|nr:DinB family protein [Phycicoccus flavus]NHA67094.1 DinB family protein [Phycicoccus flavus]
MTDTPTTEPPPAGGERADLLESLRTQRFLFLRTVDGLSDEQAAATPTVGTLCLGGLVKHLTLMERQWTGFVLEGPSAMAGDEEEFTASFTMAAGETLADLVAAFTAAGEATDAAVASVDLDATRPLPPAPWFEPGAVRSARRSFVHLAAEIAQHAGHADILREALDGQRTMA